MLQLAKQAFKRTVIHRLRRADQARRRSLPSAFNGLPPDLWGYEVVNGELTLHGQRISSLLEQFGTPLHIVSLPWLRKTQEEFLSPFRDQLPNVKLATSYKTNPVPAVLQCLHECGTYAEVISEFELWLAGRLGVPSSRIIVNGPGKTRSMIERSCNMAVKIINIDGTGEIDLIASEAQRLHRRQQVGIRVTTSVGWSSQFGLPIATGAAMAAIERIVQNPWLDLVGLHLHIGTGLKSVDLYALAIEEVLTFAKSASERFNVKWTTLDLGGGFGVPTVRGRDAWDDRMLALGHPAREAYPPDCPSPGAYASRIGRLVAEILPEPQSVEIFFEAGRAITSSSQSLFLKVIAMKEDSRTRRLILDGGKNITIPLGWETHKIFPVQQLDRHFSTDTSLYGPLCHPGDIIALHLQLPELKVGDHVAIMDAGAYFVPNQMNFSNPRPGILAVDSDGARLVRHHETFEDIVRYDELR